MDWDQVAARQHGVVSREQLRAAGLVDRSISRLTERHQLWPLLESIFLVRGAPLTYAARSWAVILWSGGVLGFESAAYVWEMSTVRPALVHVCVANPDLSHMPAWVRLHRQRALIPDWGRTTRVGLPVTTQSWTVLDLVGYARSDGEASVLLDRGLQRTWVAPGDVERRLREFRGRHGNARLRRLSRQLNDGAAAESERLLHRILRQNGVSGWTANSRIHFADGSWVVGDVVFKKQKLLIEVDGWAFHSDPDRFRRDRARQNALVNLGWTVLRFVWTDLIDRQQYVAATTKASLSVQKDAG